MLPRLASTILTLTLAFPPARAAFAAQVDEPVLQADKPIPDAEEPPPPRPRSFEQDLSTPRPKRSFIPLVVGGGILAGSLVVAYVSSVGFALAGIDENARSCPDCHALSQDLLLPFVGPWMAAGDPVMTSGHATYAAILGLSEAAGLGVTLWGWRRFVTSGKPQRLTRADDVGPVFLCAPTRGGAIAAVSGKFSLF